MSERDRMCLVLRYHTRELRREVRRLERASGERRLAALRSVSEIAHAIERDALVECGRETERRANYEEALA